MCKTNLTPLFPKDIDPENDKLISESTLEFPCAFNTSYHIVKSYEVRFGNSKGRKYHLFIHKSGKSVMNFTPSDYINFVASNGISISPEWTIFLMLNYDSKREISCVPDSYREA